MKKSLILIPIFFILASCGNKVTESVVTVGKTSFNELKSLMGEPKRIDKDKNDTKLVAVYSDDQKYQVENQVVVAQFRAPYEAEKSFLYWKHFCRNEETTLRDLESKKETHQKPEQEFSCKASKVTVIYDPNIDQIVRVINYAQ